MTSREFTSGFDFWSRGRLCMAVMHIPIKFGAYIFIYNVIFFGNFQFVIIKIHNTRFHDIILVFGVFYPQSLGVHRSDPQNALP